MKHRTIDKKPSKKKTIKNEGGKGGERIVVVKVLGKRAEENGGWRKKNERREKGFSGCVKQTHSRR